MQVTSTHHRRLPQGAALLVALAFVALGFAALATQANAAFTLNSGTLALTDGAGNTDPPSGSWVTLPTDDPEHDDPAYFTNTSSSWTGEPDDFKYTLIRNTNLDDSETALELGAPQAGGIFGDTTDPFQHFPFSGVTTKAPKLVFYGSPSDTKTRKLKFGYLPLDIEYGGNTYNVSTKSKPGGTRVVPLTGHIIGDATVPGAAKITLDWITDLDEPGFDTYTAHFHWEGHYFPAS